MAGLAVTEINTFKWDEGHAKLSEIIQKFMRELKSTLMAVTA